MAENDETAFREFHALWCGRLWRYLVVATAGDEHAARDALAATLLKVVRHIRIFDDEAVFWSWLTVLARTALADQRKAQRRYSGFLGRLAQLWQGSFSGPGQEAIGAESDMLGLLPARLADCPAEDRALLEAKYFRGESVRAIAQRLGVSEKSIESRLTRARVRLKESLLAALRHEKS